MRPSRLREWPVPFDPAAELDWGDPVTSRRLLLEHLDEAHDSASRRPARRQRQLRALLRLLPAPPARILDAACGPGLYAVPLARHGYTVTGVDVGPAVLRHARVMAQRAGVEGRCRFLRRDLRGLQISGGFDAAVLIYHVLDAFPRSEKPAVLRGLAAAVPEGRVIVEMRLRPNHPPGRTMSWEIASHSLLGDRPHLLLSDSVWEPRRGIHIIRETAVYDDGSTAVQQTTAALTPLARIPGLFARAGLEVERILDGFGPRRAGPESSEVVVVASVKGRQNRRTRARI